ncbi:type II toxin-antitoxin system VapC family toxin (plasmid) [Aliirhizobium terrae]|uniref:type II toxin-antitoxin system VapC family toxin n=1 Tax=Terrirhizobium terrae TaxID=2926709 RepID=UPI0025751E90|nr:type II toxin-antitoxin system VapC family toxin [Rhizobium sp. CC-CFT758]WJH38770.1 type II toxin-antitoxin system VapC family toxin [Rhizobium sp. CC-CFT758]
MTAYLLDTNIISKFAPDKNLPSAEVRDWFHQQGEADALFLSAMTVAEVERGLRSLHRRGGFERAKRLSLWLDFITTTFDDRILPMDIVVARIAGSMEDEASGKGQSPGLGDIVIAATARAYDLTVITENLRHFEPLNVAVDLPAFFRAV